MADFEELHESLLRFINDMRDTFKEAATTQPSRPELQQELKRIDEQINGMRRE
jgi:hypothetical protein